MPNPNLNNRKSIKYYVKRYLEEKQTSLANKVVIDVPAGNGATAEILLDIGAKVKAFDLFPEYFTVNNLTCERADIADRIPVSDNSADMVICQEGIEHFSDQLKVLKEFNRVLRLNGKLLITTPSYSNLSAKLSYLLFESETTGQMPPNEIDDIWMSDKTITNEIYHGHIFLIGLQKLRTLGKIAGFKVDEIRYIRLSRESLLVFPLFYPFILIRSFMSYFRSMRKNKGVSYEQKKKVYLEQLLINISPAQLLNKHTFIVFEKEKDCADVDFRNETLIRSFDDLT